MWHLKISSLAFQQEVHGQISTLQEIHVHGEFHWSHFRNISRNHPYGRIPTIHPYGRIPECPVLGCKEDPGDTKWISPSLLYEQAYNWHLLYNYPFSRSPRSQRWAWNQTSPDLSRITVALLIGDPLPPVCRFHPDISNYREEPEELFDSYEDFFLQFMKSSKTTPAMLPNKGMRFQTRWELRCNRLSCRNKFSSL